MILLLVLGIGAVIALHGITSTPTPPAPPTTVRRNPCSVPTCPLDADWAINGWQLCTDHAQPILARGPR